MWDDGDCRLLIHRPLTVVKLVIHVIN